MGRGELKTTCYWQRGSEPSFLLVYLLTNVLPVDVIGKASILPKQVKISIIFFQIALTPKGALL